jgi:hypothetical protein
VAGVATAVVLAVVPAPNSTPVDAVSVLPKLLMKAAEIFAYRPWAAAIWFR